MNITVYGSVDGKTSLRAEQGETLLSLLKREGVALGAPCGGRGTCGKCRVIAPGAPVTGLDRDLLSPGDIAEGVRLACALVCTGGLEVTIIGGDAAILTGGAGRFELDPAVTDTAVELQPPTIEDQRGDDERLLTALPVTLTPDVLASLPGTLREAGFKAVVRAAGGTALRVMSAPARLLGVAVDIGTTTLAAYLMDLATGEQLDVDSALNPQRAYGADVISRSDAASTPEGLHALSALIRDEISGMCARFARRNGLSAEDIAHVTLAGNTIMLHLLAGIPPTHIAVSPFIPALTGMLTVPAQTFGIPLPYAVVTLLPSVAGYVGADTIAAVMASGMDEAHGVALLADIGTNGEIVLGGAEGLLCCSTAAGPAFEGAHIQHGMGGVRGAINKVALTANGLSFETIGGEEARGICGSGIVDMVAGLLSTGVMDAMGRLDADSAPAALKAHMGEFEGKPAFYLTDRICFTQKDAREVQLAKGAIAAGIEVLMRERGVALEEITDVYLAGGFGSYIDLDSACAIGLLPAALRTRIQIIGNGAGAGAKMALLSKEHMRRASGVRARMRYIELSTSAAFNDSFINNMLFGSDGL